MKTLLESIDIAFSMYSLIPVPRVDWNEKNMKYALCFFPLVGLAVGGLQGAALYLLSQASSVSPALWAAVATALPVLLSGGIHMDGFCDTMDGLGSHQSPERKLEILKDSNAGAFAIIGCVLYFILTFGVWESLAGRLNGKAFWTLMLGYALSRSFSGFGLVTLKCAKNSGLAAMFSQAADKKRVRTVLIVWGVLIGAAMMCLNFRVGALCIGVSVLTFIYYMNMSKKQFGGITGDLAGYFLQLCELFMAASVLLGGM